jgi:putative ABC transport system permease protein
MRRYNILLILRNIRRNKTTFIINLVGLSTAFACAILIFLWVNDEQLVDKFHKNDKQLCQILENHQLPERILTQQWTPDMLGRTLAKETPEVELETSVMSSVLLGDFSLTADSVKDKAAGQFADYDFFRVFSFNLLRGDPTQVLKEKNSIVLSRKLAIRLFGTTENILGKTVEWELISYKYSTVVTGIFEDVPQNSTMKFDFVLSYDSWLDLSERVGRKIHWGNHSPCTYVVLAKGSDLKQFNSKIEGFIKSKLGGSNITLFAVPYSGQYLHGNYVNGVQSGGKIGYVRIFTLIAIFIVIIASINYMNLTTAQSSGRIKEIAIKKVNGSSQFSLITQFFSESAFISFIALLLSFQLVFFVMPLFNQITGKHLVLGLNSQVIVYCLLASLIVSILTGFYPSLHLSGFGILQSLKGKISNSASELWARKGLVVFQFAISVALISAVLVVAKQVSYIHEKDLGYNRTNLIYFSKEGGIAQHEDTFLAEAGRIDGVTDISSGGGSFIGSGSSTYDVDWEGKPRDASIRFEVIAGNYRLIETMGIDVTDGRSFSPGFGNEPDNVIINQAAAEVMGLQHPVGKTIRFWGKEKHIIGVTKNFNFETLHERINPALFYFNPSKTLTFMARIEAGKEKTALAGIAALYSRFNPGFSLDYHFIDKAYEAQYISENRMSMLFHYFASLGILISCLGLFGLAAFAAEQRTKEIGIRKVNGAKISDVMSMLNREFLIWVLVAFVIAVPVAYYFLKNWLDSFAYKTNLSWWIFCLAGIITSGIALLTVSWQSWKAAIKNPIDSLRSE